jgi:hypothetical protein
MHPTFNNKFSLIPNIYNKKLEYTCLSSVREVNKANCEVHALKNKNRKKAVL